MPDGSNVEARYAALVEAMTGRDGVTLGSGRGFGSNSLQAAGRIFAMLTDGHLVLKLPRQRVAMLLSSGEGAPFDAGKGRPMREWVVVSDESGKSWLPLAREARAFVAETGRG
jgi:hypothetical protein